MRRSVRCALAESALFQGCSIDENQFVLRQYAKGRMIDETLDGVDSVGLVISGQIDVYIIAVDGRDIRMSTLHPGECFGVYDLLTETSVQMLLRSGDDTVVGYVAKSVILQKVEEDHRFALRYAKLCNEMIHFLLFRIELLTMQTNRDRLISYLLAQRSPGGCVYIPCSREELAWHLGMSRATLFREIARLSEKGVLQNRNGVLFIPDADAMERLLFRSSM